MQPKVMLNRIDPARREAMLAKRREVMRSYGWGETTSRDAREQALRAFARRKP